MAGGYVLFLLSLVAHSSHPHIPPLLRRIPSRFGGRVGLNPGGSDRGGGRDPVLILPGFLSGKEAYRDLEANLHKRDIKCEILDISPAEWWPTLAGGSFDFYLIKLNETVTRMRQDLGEGARVQLLGHSAGGWLARLYMGPNRYNGRIYNGSDYVSQLVTLGTPHYSQELYPFGRVSEKRTGEDPTLLNEKAMGSSLWFTNANYPGAYHPNVRYISVCGRSVRGREWRLGVPTSEAVAHGSYKANCGSGDRWGDGVTDVETALLEGSEHIVLEGCYHNPSEKWYGSDDFIDEWVKYLL
ncbi:hypothetical protein AAMO2058_000361400 [Amorphochlora amoebiformis]